MLNKCLKGLHDSADTDTQGRCRGCQSLGRKLRWNERNGNPLCWTGKHSEPEEGIICPCGEHPPTDETYIDWAIVERASHDLELPRPMTVAEELSTIRTLQRRLNCSDHDAVQFARDAESFWPSCLGNTDHVAYVVWKWARRNGNVPDVIRAMDLYYAPEDPADYPERYPSRVA